MKQLLLAALLFGGFSARAAGTFAETSIADLCLRTSGSYTPVTTHGTVIDAFQDDIDSRVSFLLIKDGEYAIPVAIYRISDERLRKMIDCEITVRGECLPITGDRTHRTFAGPFIDAVNANAILTVRSVPKNPFDHPPLENLARANPIILARMGKRTVVGTVLAAWKPHGALVRLADKRLVKLDLIAECTLPSPGESLRAAGYPTTDQFHVNLQRVVWESTGTDSAPFVAPDEVSADILFGTRDKPAVNPDLYGRTIRLTGIVRAIADASSSHPRLHLESDGRLVTVDPGVLEKPFAGLAIGTTLAVSGVCLIDSEDWQPFDVFPRLKGVTIVLREPNDLLILSRPPWWSIRRIGWLVATLVILLAAILVWNRILNRLVTRRSRQLLREELAAVQADLRTSERTNLAIELHDALSQNLTGVALEVKTVARLAPKDLPAALAHLARVQHSLGACREELRTCLWDLRNDASGRANMDEAIRTALQPVIGETKIRVRFAVPRSRLSESTVAAVLRIVRELVVNAIRHGAATRVDVAGSLEGDRLLFSVTDDGCGFDPAAVAGIESGHFGLQGIRERLAKFHGEFAFAPGPCGGTRARVSLDLPPVLAETSPQEGTPS